MHIGKVIADYRYANRIGVRDLAKEIGISAATLNRIELGNGCDSASLLKIAGWLFWNGADARRKRTK